MKSYCQLLAKLFSVLLLAAAWFFHVGVLVATVVFVFIISSHDRNGLKNKQKRGISKGYFSVLASVMFFGSIIVWPITHYIVGIAPSNVIYTYVHQIISEYSAYAFINVVAPIPPDELLAEKYIIARVAWLGLFCGVVCVDGNLAIFVSSIVKRIYVAVFTILITPILFVFGPLFILPSYDGDVLAQSLSFVVGTWLFVCFFVSATYWLNVLKYNLFGEGQNVSV